MKTVLSLLAPLALAAMLFLSPAAAPAATSKAEVVDNASFFSPDAVTTANEKLASVEQKYSRQLRVETYPEIPSDLKGQYSEATKREFFQKWTRQRAQQVGVRGVFVLICRDPSTLQVEIGNSISSSGLFTQADRSRLRDLMVQAFKEKNYDKGLLDAVDYFEKTLAQRSEAKAEAPSGAAATPRPYNLPPAQTTPRSVPAPSPTPTRSFNFGGLLLIGLIVVVALFVLRRLFGGARSNPPSSYDRGYGAAPGGQPGYPPGAPYGYSGGGGGFGRGFGGGILGGLLGGMLGNQMFGRHSDDSSAHAAPPPSDPGTFNEPPAPPPSDFSGGGDALGGGGDFGGGGGGDFSGGGGDAGGGGGDF
jgi:uncharacterized membrane protein YgcG